MAKDTVVGLGDIVTQLRITNRLLSAQLKADGKMKQMDLVALLSSSGASNKEIADVLDTTEAAVKSILQRMRKKSAKKELDVEREE